MFILLFFSFSAPIELNSLSDDFNIEPEGIVNFKDEVEIINKQQKAKLNQILEDCKQKVDLFFSLNQLNEQKDEVLSEIEVILFSLKKTKKQQEKKERKLIKNYNNICQTLNKNLKMKKQLTSGISLNSLQDKLLILIESNFVTNKEMLDIVGDLSELEYMKRDEINIVIEKIEAQKNRITKMN